MDRVAGAHCSGNYFAGLWQTDYSGAIQCTESLSGTTNVPENSMAVKDILDRDEN